MFSKLGKSAVEELRSEGLEPSYEDICYLNELGLRAEKNSDLFMFSATPRLAFLGDTVLREPCIAVRLWIEQARQLFPDEGDNPIWVIAYALATPPPELPGLNDKNLVAKSVVRFRDEKLLGHTYTQILAAIDYALNGTEEDFSSLDPKRKADFDSVYEIPDDGRGRSAAKQLLLEAVASGIPTEDAEKMLSKDAERMVIVSALNHGGEEVKKSESAKWMGRFCVAKGKIRTRLKKEKEAQNG